VDEERRGLKGIKTVEDQEICGWWGVGDLRIACTHQKHQTLGQSETREAISLSLSLSLSLCLYSFNAQSNGYQRE